MNEQQKSRQIESGKDNAGHVEAEAPTIECTRKDTMPRKMRSRIFVDLQPDEWDRIVATTAKSGLQTVSHVVRSAIREYLYRHGLLSQSDCDRVSVSIQARDGGISRHFKASIRSWEFDGLVAIAKHDGDAISRTLAHAVRHYVALRGVSPLPPEYLATVKRVRTERDVILTTIPGEIQAGVSTQHKASPQK